MESRRTPLVQLTADLATVLGLRNEPAYLPGHRPIDPDLARELAHNATLQPILTELVDLALTAGLLTPERAAATGHAGTDTDKAPAHDEAGGAHSDAAADADSEAVADTVAGSAVVADSVPDADSDAVTDTATETDTAVNVETDTAATAADSESDAESATDANAAEGETDQRPAGRTDTDPVPAPAAEPVASPLESALRSRLCHPRLAASVARGSRHRPAALPLCPQVPKPILVPMRQGYLYDEFTELLATCPNAPRVYTPTDTAAWPRHHPVP